MSYTVQAVINRDSQKAKTFSSKESALRFMAKILTQYNLQVDKYIEKNVVGVEEYICRGDVSRIFILPSAE